MTPSELASTRPGLTFMLEVRVAPLNDLLHDDVSSPPDADHLTVLSSARAALAAGPASAVNNVEELL